MHSNDNVLASASFIVDGFWGKDKEIIGYLRVCAVAMSFLLRYVRWHGNRRLASLNAEHFDEVNLWRFILYSISCFFSVIHPCFLVLFVNL